MASSYLPSRAKAAPRVASAMASGTAVPVCSARSTRLKNPMATGTMSSAPCRFSAKTGGDVNAAPEIKCSVLLRSEQQLRAELEDTRFVGTRYLPEAAVRHTRVGIGELRVVEGVECFQIGRASCRERV